jgi:hypothetical protein
MAMSKEKAIQTVARLLALAENKTANPNEAAVAAAQAQRIMEQHNLDRAIVDNERGDLLTPLDECELFDGHDDEHLPLWVGGKQITWRTWLASGLAKLNDCAIVVYSGGGICKLTVVGTPTDVAVLRYVFTFVAREIDRLGKQAARRGVIYGRTGGNNFRIGAVEAVLHNVEQQKREARREFVREHGSRGRRAIVRLDRKALATNEAKSRFFKKLGKGRRATMQRDTLARLAGHKAGKSINVHTSLGSGGASNTPALKGK